MIRQLTPQRIAVVGDWHGNARYVFKALKRLRSENVDLIIHLGDFGYFPKETSSLPECWFANHVSNLIDKLDLPPLFFIDGNHEHHALLNTIPLDKDGVRPIAKNVFHLPRGYAWEWHGEKYLALGGATSVDANMRTEGIDWFPEESLSLKDVENTLTAGKVKAIFAHDAPDRYIIPGIAGNVTWIPRKLLIEASVHRRIMGMIVDEVQPDWFFHGHFHVAYASERALPNGGVTEIIGLDRDGTNFSSHMVIYDVVEQEIELLQQ